MKEIIKYAAANRITNSNSIIKNSLENKIKEDKTIRVIAKEVTTLITKLSKKKSK